VPGLAGLALRQEFNAYLNVHTASTYTQGNRVKQRCAGKWQKAVLF
jgi:hypothetical protein